MFCMILLYQMINRFPGRSAIVRNMHYGSVRIWFNITRISCNIIYGMPSTLQWRHNEHDGVPNHQRFDCLLDRLFRRKWKLRVTGFYEGNPPATGDFSSHRAINAENVSIWWYHHGIWNTRHILLWNVFCQCLEQNDLTISKLVYKS